MIPWALVVFVALQSALLLLDLWATRGRERLQSDRLRPSTIAFLLLVLAVYFALQWAGGRLLPPPVELLELARQIFAEWGATPPETPLSTFAGISIGVMLFYTAGFWDYLVHRCFSHSRPFWFTHEYHHLPRQVTVWMPGIFARPFGFVPVAIAALATAATIGGVLTAFRLPNWDLRPFVPVALSIALLLTASHSDFLRRYAVVHRVMRVLCLTTPQEHLLHHRIDSRCNFGNFTTLWDRLFGTYEDPEGVDLESVRLGLSYDRDFLGAITLGRLRLTAEQRKKFQIARYCNLDQDPGDS